MIGNGSTPLHWAVRLPRSRLHRRSTFPNTNHSRLRSFVALFATPAANVIHAPPGRLSPSPAKQPPKATAQRRAIAPTHSRRRRSLRGDGLHSTLLRTRDIQREQRKQRGRRGKHRQPIQPPVIAAGGLLQPANQRRPERTAHNAERVHTHTPCRP